MENIDNKKMYTNVPGTTEQNNIVEIKKTVNQILDLVKKIDEKLNQSATSTQS